MKTFIKRAYAALKASPQALGLFVAALLNQLVGIGLLDQISDSQIQNIASFVNFCVSGILVIVALLMMPQEKE